MAEALIADGLTAFDSRSRRPRSTSLPALRHILRTELSAVDYAGAKVTANMIAPYENAASDVSDPGEDGSGSGGN